MVEKDEEIFGKFKKSQLSSIDKLDLILEFIKKIDEIFYTNYTIERNNLLKEEILSSIKILDEYLSNINQLSKQELSFIYYSKSIILDKLPEYSKIAEESANKSLKFNPFCSDSYNCIAHIIWKKGDISLALNYFNQALQIDQKDKVTLRNISMCMRAKKAENENEKKNIATESLSYAKQAVEVDIKDSESWCIFLN